MSPEWTRNEIKVCRFVRAHYKPWANAPFGSLWQYFEWYSIMNLLGVVLHEGEVIAVGTARFFHHLEDYREDFKHDPAGRFIRINLYGALCTPAIAILGGQLARLHDIRGCTFLWHRDPDELGPPRQYSVKAAMRMCRLLCTSGRKSELRECTTTT